MSKRTIEWSRVLQIFFLFLVLPTLAFYLIAHYSLIALRICYYSILTIFVFQALLSFLYSGSALSRRPFKERPTAQHRPLPKTSFIVSAYLPNEVEVVEATLLNILQRVVRPPTGIEVILGYNTPHLEPIETRLKQLAVKWPELVLANAYGSRSKSENLNYVLDLASGELIVLLDADHLVMPDCLARAWRWLDEGYDAVQGRCKIRNGDESTTTALVEVEFEGIYGISHYAKSRLFDTALFGGSNGYWKAPVLKAMGFRADRLTEDIDCTIRALLAGYHIVHDRSIISTELAPTTAGGLWHQRKRWAQGWFQVSREYQWAVLHSSYFNRRQKFVWTTLFMWRIGYDLISHFLFPVVFAWWWFHQRISFPMDAYVVFATIVTLSSGPFEGLVAYKNAAPPRASIGRYLFYALLVFPYTLFKNTIQMVAIIDELRGKKEWVISERVKK